MHGKYLIYWWLVRATYVVGGQFFWSLVLEGGNRVTMCGSHVGYHVASKWLTVVYHVCTVWITVQPPCRLHCGLQVVDPGAEHKGYMPPSGPKFLHFQAVFG